ncbi:uncharacterized protein LOC126260419 [Schistocerca nitens]|uniref:uncharacterized protein LOC126260419 n=1 Tax=Schistocerca nitens TaxID=7011 RepID=UPI00211752F6|nr:uncharacterized protein LOC126260419 [Schistocerca nitens]
MGNTVRKRDLSSSAPAAAKMPAKPAKTVKKKRGGKTATQMSALVAQSRPGPSQARLQPDQLPPAPDPEQHAFAHLRKTLREDFEAFLLNNVLLSVRFFENFDIEIKQLRNAPLSESEAHCNSELYRHERHCVWPDALQDHVAKRVAFRPKHGPNKNCTEALCSRRIIVVHSNVTAVDGSDSINGYNRPSTYKLAVESSKSQGYVRLRSINAPNKQRRMSYDVIDSGKSEEPIYAEHNDVLISERNDTRQTDIENHPPPLPPFPQSLPLEVEDETISESSASHDQSATLSPGEQVLQDLEKRIEGFPNASSDTKPEFSHVLPLLEVTETTKLRYQHVLGPQNPEQVSSEVENRTSTRRPSGTGQPLQYRLLPSINIKPAKSLSDLDHIGQKPNRTRLSPPSSESSGYKSISPHRSNPSSRGSESDYGYSTITELKTPRPVNTRRLGHMPEQTCGIPSECFIRVEVRTIQTGTYDDSDSESDGIYSKSHNPQQRSRKLYDEYYYLNSTMYMASFADIFVERISETLGFTAENVELAEMQGDKIYCDTVKSITEKIKMKVRMDITPSIHCKSWPVQALEWHLRNRVCILDRSQNLKYTWPTSEMITNVVRMGYHILPIGYTPTHGSNKESHIEWQIAFPEAENYLEQYLSHPQIFCYLFTLALQKNFLDPLVKSELKLLPAHIRSVLFWECEKNYAIWKEDRLGESLLRLLRAVYDCLKRRRLPDYFLKSHNKFESIPGRNLSKIQEKLHSIMENPVKYALIAARNLYYISKDQDTFYPKFDFEKLDEIISAENYAKLLNPLLAQPPKPQKIVPEEDTSEEEEDDEGYDLDRQWHKDAHRDIEAKKAARRITKAPKTVAETINVSIHPQKNDPMRSKLVLELFIPHFIEMANYSNKYRSHQQAIFYLKHAERLTRLLAEQPAANKTDIEMLMTQIKSAEQATRASERYSLKLLWPTTKPPNESSTDKSPTFARRRSTQEITIVDVHQKPKRVVSIELPNDVSESIDL